MYKQVNTDKIATLINNVTFEPIATLADEYGGRCQISIDDHCYKLSLKQSNGKYKTTPYIFNEAFIVLKELPILSKSYDQISDSTIKELLSEVRNHCMTSNSSAVGISVPMFIHTVRRWLKEIG